MIILAPGDIKLVRYAMKDGSTIEGTFYGWHDGTSVLEVGEEIITAKDGMNIFTADAADTTRPTLEHTNREKEPAKGRESPVVPESAATDPVEIEVTTRDVSEEASILTFNISSSKPWKDDIIIVYTTIGETAEASSDFEKKKGIVALSAGKTSTQLAIPLIDDDEIEEDELLWLFVSVYSDIATISHRKIAATIEDNDG